MEILRWVAVVSMDPTGGHALVAGRGWFDAVRIGLGKG
jgi:hypothetical protein